MGLIDAVDNIPHGHCRCRQKNSHKLLAEYGTLENVRDADSLRCWLEVRDGRNAAILSKETGYHYYYSAGGISEEDFKLKTGTKNLCAKYLQTWNSRTVAKRVLGGQ